MNSTDSLGAFPPGIEPNYDNPPDHKTQTIILHSVCLTLVTAAVLMRLYTRTFITKFSFGLDDVFMLLSWAGTVAWSGVLIASENYGIGRHLWDIPPEWLVPGLKLLFISELMYCIIVLTLKLSFLLFFNRIFAVDDKLKWFIWFAMFANVVFYIVVFFDTLFLCKPIALSWDPFLDGECGPEEALPYATGIWAFVSDFFIFFLPVRSVWGLNMKFAKKVKLIAAFGVGLFACIASVIRFVYTIQLVNNMDSTWNYIQLSLWAVLEIDIGIICGCLFTFPAFFERFKPTKWDHYMSRFTSYISGFSKSSNPSLSTRSRHNGGVHATNTSHPNSDSYQKLNEKGQAQQHLREDVDSGSNQSSRSNSGSGNILHHDIEWIPFTDVEDVQKTANIKNHPMDGYEERNSTF